MLEAWQIVLIVIGSVFILFILIQVTGLGFFFSFKSMLSKHITALNVVLQTKYDNINKLLSIMGKYDEEIVNKYQKELDEIDIKHLGHPHTKEGEQVRNKLSLLKEELLSILDRNEIFLRHEEINLAKAHILELDKVYYFQIMTYNADVIGYNYWIRFLPNRFIFKLFKVKEKEVIA